MVNSRNLHRCHARGCTHECNEGRSCPSDPYQSKAVIAMAVLLAALALGMTLNRLGVL